MQQASMEKQTYDVLVDCIGQKCPLPVLRARKVLKTVQPGTLVCVETSDPMALVDVPHMTREDGHHLLDQSTRDVVTSFLIRRGSV